MEHGHRGRGVVVLGSGHILDGQSWLLRAVAGLLAAERKEGKKKTKKNKEVVIPRSNRRGKKIKTTERTILLLYDLFKVVMQLINFYITVE